MYNIMKSQITYIKQGDYLLPNLKLSEQPKFEIGIWGKRHLKYIEKYHKIRYFNLLTSCKIIAYLTGIDMEATEMFDRLVNQFVQQEGVNEQLKADNLMMWVAKMNIIRNQANEIVDKEIVLV